MVRIITFGSKKIWLYFEQLHIYQDDDDSFFSELEEYICYFKFSEPTPLIHGELIRGQNNIPIVFKSIEEAEEFATEYLQVRFHVNA